TSAKPNVFAVTLWSEHTLKNKNHLASSSRLIFLSLNSCLRESRRKNLDRDISVQLAAARGKLRPARCAKGQRILQVPLDHDCRGSLSDHSLSLHFFPGWQL